MQSSDNVLFVSGSNKLVKTRYGVMLVNAHDNVVGLSLSYYGEYFELEASLFRQLVRPGDVVIDVGANIGAHVVPLAVGVGSAGRVVAFEPYRLNFQLLCANAALNGLTNVDARCEGLGRRNEAVQITDAPMDHDDNYGALTLTQTAHGRSVRVSRLDDVFDQPKLRFMKIDVEGMEADVLSGAAKTLEKLKPALYVENDRIEKSRDLLILLDELEYDCYWFLPSFHNPDNFLKKSSPLYASQFVNDGQRFQAQGMGVNLLCLHRSAKANLAGMPRVLHVDEHPCLSEYNARFLA